MKKWEDILKDKVEAPDGALPESVFAEFHTRLDRAAHVAASKSHQLVWIVVSAVAAGLAAILLLHKSAVPEEGIRSLPKPPAQTAVTSDPTAITEPVREKPLLAKAVIPRAVEYSDEKSQEPEAIGNTGPAVEEKEEATDPAVDPGTNEADADDKPVISINSPFPPETINADKKSFTVGPALGAIAGSGLVAAVLTPLFGGFAEMDETHIIQGDTQQGNADNPEQPRDEIIGGAEHGFPLKAGISTKIPLSDRLNLTTGIYYSLYSSTFTYSISGEKKQYAHYLGVPVRLDFLLASTGWLDIYVGGGIEGDYCVAATLAGTGIKKDGFSLSLTGAGGLQLNITKHLGLYAEPQILWNIPSESRILDTYRSNNPIMFSAAAGLRINLDK
ncbi:MAG: hypothetical protein IJJ72_08200 [Bacteroidales bacterium]|nr:hypothetical protein [Bacteroidales bacterium]